MIRPNNLSHMKMSASTSQLPVLQQQQSAVQERADGAIRDAAWLRPRSHSAPGGILHPYPPHPSDPSDLLLQIIALERRASVDLQGKATEACALELSQFEASHRAALSVDGAARGRLQQLQARLGVPTAIFPQIPASDRPYWLAGADPLANFQSSPGLPREAGIVIIGAGITGCALMHMLVGAAKDLLTESLVHGLACNDRHAALSHFEQRAETQHLVPDFRDAFRKALLMAHERLALCHSATAESIQQEIAQALFDTSLIVVVDSDDPCQGASGRNGGNRGFTENFDGTYDGIVAERLKLHLSDGVSLDEAVITPELHAKARFEVDFILKAWDESRSIQENIIRDTGIECDLKKGGWLKVAENPDEMRALEADAQLLAEHGLPTELLSKEVIAERYQIATPEGGNLTHGATYHPVKFVRGVITHNIKRGGRLYTRTKVLSVDSTHPNAQCVKVERRGHVHEIHAKRVIAATNAYTRTLFPEFTGIEPYRSQVAVFEHVEPVLGKLFYTRRQGDDYSNHPQPNILIQGGGIDAPVESCETPPVHPEVHVQLMTYADEKCGPDKDLAPGTEGKRYFAPSAEWAGLMGFTPQNKKLPFAGWLRNNAVALCGGYSGYGNTFALYVAELVTRLMLNGASSQWAPLLDPQPFIETAPPA